MMHSQPSIKITNNVYDINIYSLIVGYEDGQTNSSSLVTNLK